MPFLSYQQVEADNTVKSASDLTVPNNATHAELQASGQNINYTMDDSTDPVAGAGNAGMVLLTTEAPKLFLISDVNRIRFIRGSGSNGQLNVHYYSGRNV